MKWAKQWMSSTFHALYCMDTHDNVFLRWWVNTKYTKKLSTYAEDLQECKLILTAGMLM